MEGGVAMRVVRGGGEGVESFGYEELGDG